MYLLPKSGVRYSSEELIAHWKSLVERYPIISIEDPLDEEDWLGWEKLTQELGDRVQLVGTICLSRIRNGLQRELQKAVVIQS